MQANLTKLFRAYDVRGVYGKDFDETFARQFGAAFGTWLIQFKKTPTAPSVFVGQDVRPSSPSLTKALIEGLVSTGVQVTDAGITPSPLMYYLVWKHAATGGIQITASHNPADQNGIKPAWNGIVLSAQDQQQIKTLIEKGSFVTGAGSVQSRNYDAEFLAHACQGLSCAKPLRVVVDAGNGTCGPLAIELVKRLGATPIPLHCDPIAGFPNHQPDPLEPANIKDIQEEVVRQKADLGIAFDGDGDRVAFIDDQGFAFSSDEALVLYLRDFASNPTLMTTKPKVLYTVVMSNLIARQAQSLGFQGQIMPVGHTHIQHGMVNDNGLVAAETSGHFFFKDNGNYDDAFYAAARFLHLASRLTQPLSQVHAALPRFFSTYAFYIPCPDETKFQVAAAVKEALEKQYPVIAIDGVRVNLAQSWGIVRVSNTGPKLNLRFEGETQQALEQVYRLFADHLAPHHLTLPPLSSVQTSSR